MRKIWPLYVNEIIKIVKKPFYIVMAILLAGIMVLMISVNEYFDSLYSYEDMMLPAAEPDEDMLEAYKQTIQSLESDIKFYKEEKLKGLLNEINVQDEEDVYNAYFTVVDCFYSELSYRETDLQRYLLLQEYKLHEWRSPTYLEECLNIVSNKNTYDSLKKYADELLSGYPFLAEIEELKGEIEYSIESSFATPDFENFGRYNDILREKNYAEYIKLSNELISADDSLSEKSKELEIQANNMILSIDPDGLETSGEKVNLIRRYVSYRQREYEGRMENGQKLSDAEIKDSKAAADELELKIEKMSLQASEQLSSNKKEVISIAISIASAIAAASILLFAAAVISDEIQTGSIKMLIIAPVKRSKIFFAKLLATITLCLAFALLIYFIFLIMCLLFGYGNPSVIYTAPWGPAEISYRSYTLVCLLLEFLKIFVYALFAIMLSALIRNSAVSTCVSLIEYFAVTNIVPVIFSSMNSSITGSLMAYLLPANNLKLSARVFPSFASAAYESGIDLMELFGGLFRKGQIPLWFSICYIAVLSFCMLYTAYDSFCRRDIK